MTSNLTAIGRSGGHVISAQMATCTAGKQLSIIGLQAQHVLSAAATRCASTILWLPRLLWLQLNGTTKQMLVHLTACWHKAIIMLLGTVMSVAASGMHHLMHGCARIKLAAQNAVTVKRARSPASVKPLQRVRTLTANLSWQDGTMNAIHHKETFPTIPL